jgi:FecR protein
MRADNSSMRFVCCLAMLFMASACFAGDAIEVVKAEGSVATSDASGKHEKTVGAKSVLPPRNVLTTGPNGRAVVRMGNTGIIVLEKNSKVELGNPKDHAGFLRHITGMIYYALNKIKGDQNIEVRSKSATIGVRGTRFLIAELPDRDEIDMRKGQVSITSPEGEFEIHKQTEQDEFEAYKQEGKDAIEKEKHKFEEYKANTEREFIEYKREFSLGANRMASFDGKRVVDRPLDAGSAKDMESVESYAEEWLKEVQD